MLWRRRGGVWPRAGVAISACRAISVTDITYNHPPLAEPLAKYGSTNMTNPHQRLGCLQGLASLAGTMDKTHWPVRQLAKSPPVLLSNYRGDADRYELMARRLQTSTFCDSQDPRLYFRLACRGDQCQYFIWQMRKLKSRSKMTYRMLSRKEVVETAMESQSSSNLVV